MRKRIKKVTESIRRRAWSGAFSDRSEVGAGYFVVRPPPTVAGERSLK